MGISKTMNTPHEKWCTGLAPHYKGRWYEACTLYACEKLGGGEGRRLLVVGSPVAEAMMLLKAGWGMTYADVRKPPIRAELWRKCDVIKLPFDDGSFDAVSSACVLTHAGLGRYGDEKARDGDERGIKEMARVLKSGCDAVITFGAVIDAPEWVDWGTTHRVYTPARARELAVMASLEILEERVFAPRLKRWLGLDEPLSKDPNEHDYISMHLRKPKAH